MTVSKKSFLGGILVVAAGSALVFSLQAGATRGHDDEGHGKLFRSGLVGNLLTDPPIHGVTRAGAAWVLRRGTATLSRQGEFELRVKGLVLTNTGTTGPVTNITASFFCAPDSDLVAAFTAGPATLEPDGDARIRQTVTVPDRCLAPVVLVHPNGAAARYIAVSGFNR
jgi:hypothetical protein